MSATLELMEAGDSTQAEFELGRILAAEPNNRLAQSLLRQIRDEQPLAQFGRESFAYRVQPGESLSSIAKRYLGDVHFFYGLARYNGIKVPRNLAGGQMIRVPGKTSAAVPAPVTGNATPAPIPAPAPAPAPTPTSVPALVSTPPPPGTATSPATPPAPLATPALPVATEAQKKAIEIARLTRQARGAFARQDLDAAVRNWDAVLVLDADNGAAKTERQKALHLKENLKKVK